MNRRWQVITGVKRLYGSHAELQFILQMPANKFKQ